ncbi:DEKNAAC102328 [Brettanomyces naardenensis]|uniref:DEKNAAC102328 n=1 Tax=Brettanomyces naardenensis TaxID=13370 RepID=A0A448YKK0_BRENA|nr:DEKNAAC102328 [Brettanomyces naardenensis]
MCRSSKCPNCKRASWKGCGKHIPKAMSGVDKSTWCNCRHPDGSVTSKEYPPKAGTGLPQ